MMIDCCKIFRYLLAVALAAGLAAFSRAQSSIAFVQQNSADPQTPQTSVSVPYSLAQTAGNLNVVVIGWNDSTATLTSVVDSSGNIYTQALIPTVQTGTATQVIYYAKNIAGAAARANTVTVTFSGAATFPDIRILEYSGIDPVNPLDGALGAQGNSVTADSGSLTTTNANDLIVGASLVQTQTTGAGAGFTSRVITVPDGDIVEDRIVTTAGSYNATAPITPSALWIMQIAAFRAASGTGGSSVSIIATSGTPQSAAINSAFSTQLQATVKDASNNPLSGVVVTFTAPASGASGTFAGGLNTATTNASGVATASVFTANAIAGGPYTVTGSVSGAATPANFLLTNLAGAPTTMTANAGTTPQSATINTAFLNALSVTVKDAGSNPVPGVNITFTAPASGSSGLFSNNTATITVATNASGVASAPFTANATAGGPYSVTAAATGLTSVNFSLTNHAPAGSIVLVQHASKDAGTTTSSTLAFASSNTAGNFIAVVIRAGKTGQVFTVRDSRGNTYRRAIQFNETIDSTTLGIFYAENIVSGSNTITVSDTISGTLRFGILEYSGVATSNSLDGAAVGSQGTGASLNSGTLTTTVGGDLVLGGMSSANPANFTAGNGYQARDFVPAEPNTKLLIEDQIQAVAGNISANASLGTSDNWGAVAAAFKSAATIPPPTFTPPSNLIAAASGPVQVNLSWSAATETGGTLTGYLIERCTGATCSNFAQIGNSATTSYNDTSANLAGSTTYNYRVRATDGTNLSGYSNTASATTAPPTFTAPSSLTASAGGSAQINLSWAAATETGGTITNYLLERCSGANCDTTPSNFAQVGTPTTTSFSDTGLTVSTPYSYRVRATDGTNFSGYSNVATATPVLGPTLSTLSLTQGPVGASITITGSSFGATRGSSTITFNGTPVTSVASWSDTSIDTSVPAGATTGNVVVTVGGIPSNSLPFTVTPPPNITGVNPNAGPIGTVVNVTGTNFGPTVGTRTSLLSFNGIAARTTSWSDTLIVAPVPAAATTGNVIVSVGGVNSNPMLYTVTPGPNIASVSPASGSVGANITINGAGFGASQGSSSLTFNGVPALPTSWSDTTIAAPVPTGATTGNIIVTVNGIASNSVPFSVTSATSIKLVQHISIDAGSTTSASLAFTTSNTAGNFIAIMIRAGKSGQVFRVSDSRGNVYKQAVSFNMTVDADTFGIFYAENVAGGANTVTVSDSILGTLRFAILEYSGVTLVNSLDVVAVSEGFGNVPNSGNLVPSLSGDLLLGGIVTADSEAFTAGAGFKIEDSVPGAGNAKLITEDQVQSAVGPAAATATLGSTDPWAAALVAFKSLAGAPPPPISVSVSPTSATVGTGGIQNFTATLQSDFQGKGVTWSLSGAGCAGSACGTLTNITSTSVTYTGPGAVPSPAGVTLTATSIADNTKTGTGAITIVLGPLTVSVSPKRAAVTMSASQTVQFTGNVVNDPSNSGLVWSVDNNNGGTAASGTISSIGLYTPGTQPGAHTITATSVANASVSASATVAVTDLTGVYTYHNDAQRTGQNLKEYALTPATINSSTFTKLFSCPTDGYVYAQPLWVANLNIGGVTRNVIYVATEHDSVYAYDADSASCVLLWKVSFLGAGVTTMPYTDIPSFTDDVFPEIGITSTPVIDPVTNTIYVEAKTKETVGSGCSSGSPCYVHRLHALDTTTGAEKFGGPKVISATGFSTFLHFNRPALLLANGTVYVAFGSHGDNCNWQGWIFGFNAGTLAQTFVWNTTNPNTCNGGAIWQGGAGPAADASGNIYFSTGNGLYDGTNNFSDSTLKLSPAGSLVDWFTPFNQSTFQANDIDLASAGVIVLPDSVGSTTHPTLALATGKVAILYLLDITAGHAMGKFHSGSNSDVQEVIPVPPPNTTQLDGGNYGVPAYWNGNIYSTGQSFPLSQFHIANGVIATPQFAQSANLFPPRGATPTVSANGNSGGVVWVLDLSAWPSSGSAILDAYDATNVGTTLFSSASSGAAAAGPSVKFTVPTVANGKVYVPGQSVITVFGLKSN